MATLTTTLNSTNVVGGARTGWSGEWGGFFRFPNNDTSPGTTRQAGGKKDGTTLYYYATLFLFNSSSLTTLRNRTVTSVTLKFSSLSGTVPASGNTYFDVRYKLNSYNGLSASASSNHWASSSGATSTTAGTTVARNFITTYYNSSTKSISLPTSLPLYGYVIGPNNVNVATKSGRLLTFGATALLIVEYTAYEYNIKYHKGTNGTGTEYTDTKTEGTNITLRGAIFTRTGYTQTGWATSDGGAKVYNLSATYSTNAALDLYPYWEPNVLTILYQANGGIMADTHGSEYALDNDGYVTRNGVRGFHTINYDSSDDPYNYNDSNKTNLVRTGYIGKSGAEWNTSADGTGTSFSQTISHTALTYCPSLSSGNQTITLYVNWEASSVIHIKCNGTVYDCPVYIKHNGTLYLGIVYTKQNGILYNTL